MAGSRRDPYSVLGVPASASDEELRRAYRRLVKAHHPDHNSGSPESERRFEEVQDAYARIRQARAAGTTAGSGATGSVRETSASARDASGSARHAESRLAEMEREVRKAHEARERAERAAREAAARARWSVEGTGEDARKRPSDEDLGYVTTDDNFSKIFSDLRSELSSRFADGRDHPLARRVADLIDELDPRSRE